MTLRHFLLLAVLLTGCNGTTETRKTFFDPDATSVQAGEGQRREYTLTLLMGFEMKPYYIQWVSIDLLLSGWREKHGHRFVLEKQNSPAYTLFTYYQGMFSKKFKADVKTLVEIRDTSQAPHRSADMARGEARAKEALTAWRKRYPALMKQYEYKEDPKIIYYTPTLRGRFGFYRTPEGDLLREASGQIRTDILFNKIEEIYRWHKPDKPDPVTPSNFFKGLAAALEAWDTSPFPERSAEELDDTEVGETWTARNTHSIQAFVNGVVLINKVLQRAIDTGQSVPFKMTYKLVRRDGDVARIESETTDFGNNASLGQGYQLIRFKRSVAYDISEKVVLLDEVTLEAQSKKGDRVQMTLSLKARGQ